MYDFRGSVSSGAGVCVCVWRGVGGAAGGLSAFF